MKSRFLRILTAALLLLLLVPCLAQFPVSALSDGKYVIVLDPGHGAKDTGTCEASKPEAWYNLRVARACKAALEADGRFKVYMTRSEDNEYLTLMERGMFANEKNADLLLSMHFDGSEDVTRRGCAVYTSVLDRFNKADLGDKILDEIVARTGIPRSEKDLNRIKDHGDKIYYWSEELNWSLPELPATGPVRDYYGIIKWCCYFGIDSFIVEHAFMSSAADREIVEQEETLTALGEADAAAIIAYFTGCDHSFESARCFPSNCMMPGKDCRRCTKCGCRKEITTRERNSDAHIWLESSRVAPSCEKDGYIEYTCEVTRAMNVGKEGWVRDHTYKETIPALGHDYAVTEEKKPGHGFDGYQVLTCRNCGKSYRKELAGEPHDYQYVETVAPTCEADGYKRSVCTVCRDEQREKTESAIGHSYEKTGEVAATCEQDGKELYACKNCGGTREEPIPALGHQEGAPVGSEATCTEAGSLVYTCERCGKTRTETPAALGHEIPEAVVIPATCTADGTHTGLCTRCGETVSEPSEKALGHQKDAGKVTPPTCTSDGSVDYVCTICGERFTEPGEKAAGHAYKIISSTEASCTQPGEAVQSCAVCGDTITETRADAPAAGHRYEEVTANHLTRRICIVCGEEDPDFEPINTLSLAALAKNPAVLATVFGVLVLIVVAVVLRIVFGKARGFMGKIYEEEKENAEEIEAELAAKNGGEPFGKD